MSQAAASATGSLPPVISEYLAASDRGDAEAVVRCFAEDASGDPQRLGFAVRWRRRAEPVRPHQARPPLCAGILLVKRSWRRRCLGAGGHDQG